MVNYAKNALVAHFFYLLFPKPLCEKDLFDEPISQDNVKLMGEMIALQALRTVKKYDFKVADKLYIGLIKDLHRMSKVDYIVSEGYDYAQTAICFLCQFIGRYVNEIYGKDRKGKEITIKLACYREVEKKYFHFLRKDAKTEQIDFTDYKALPMDKINCFEKEERDYDKADAIISAMHLTKLEMAILECYINGMVQSQVMAEFGIGRGSLNYRKAAIRKKYRLHIGEYN